MCVLRTCIRTYLGEGNKLFGHLLDGVIILQDHLCQAREVSVHCSSGRLVGNIV